MVRVGAVVGVWRFSVEDGEVTLEIRAVVGVVFSCTGLFGFLMPSIGDAASIDWEVRNRFRAFDYLVPTGSGRAAASAGLFERLAPRSDDVDSQQWSTRLSAEGGSPYSPQEPGPWIESAGRGRAAYARDFVDLPARIAVRVSLNGSSEELSSLERLPCSWRVQGNVVAEQACTLPLALDDMSSERTELSVYQGERLIATETIAPKLRIILGLGDSYGAGEGSPDRPTAWKSGIPNKEWPLGKRKATNKFVERPAGWWSNRCNRSFYSYQNMVALRIAAEDKRSIVSFVHFSCAGAEVIDGLFAPQRMAPGHPRRNCRSPNGTGLARRTNRDAVDPRCDVPYSQLSGAVNILCREAPRPATQEQLARFRAPMRATKYARNELSWINELVTCSPGKLRKVDLLLVSVGGNDMGFGGVILWGLMPVDGRSPAGDMVVELARKEGGAVCPYQGSGGAKCQGLTADVRIADLAARYSALNLALKEILHVTTNEVVLNQYPNPLQNEKGDLCGDRPHSNTNNAWYGTRMLVPWYLHPKERWQLNLTGWEAAQVERVVIPKLNSVISQSANEHHWMTADVQEVMSNRGWCTGENVSLMPPSQAYQWQPYERNVRFIRTGTDAFLTQWPGYEDRADGLSGTFHPNLQGYAAIADHVLSTIRRQ